MPGKLFLCGGGDEKQTFEIDEIFLKGVKKVLYVPVAWKNEDFDACMEWFEAAMSQHKRLEINMLTDLDKATDLNWYDAVYVGGGNTFKLLKKMKESGFSERLIAYYEKGGTVYGGSAGAIIWGKDIGIAAIGTGDPDVNDVGLVDLSGFDRLNGMDLQCHYTPDQEEEHKRYSAKIGKKIVALPEESALFLHDGKAEVIGTAPIYLITPSDVKTVPSGEAIW